MNNDEKNKVLVSKKKSVVDKGAFFSAPRTSKDATQEASFFIDSLYEEVLDAAYFPAPDADKLRVVVGKNWDFAQKNIDSEVTKKQFDNDWPHPRVFYKQPIELEYCNDPTVLEGAGGHFGATGNVIEQKILLKAKVPWTALQGGGQASVDSRRWGMYIKTGIVTENGTEYEPIVQVGKNYYDHHHDSINPFTKEELLYKQPTGKAFYASFNTFYNERLDSKFFENVTGQNNNIQNSLPSIYSFLRMFLNKDLKEDNFFKLDNILSNLQAYLTSDQDLKKLYLDPLNTSPLEALLTLYGAIGTDLSLKDVNNEPIVTNIIEKIISLNFDNVDADSLFSDYYKEYAELINQELKLQYIPGASPNNRIVGLENIMSNIVFAPDTIKLMNKVDQYKKHFPFYSELEFTANVFTSIGDAMQQLFLTKTMSEVVLNANRVDGKTWSDSWILASGLGGPLGEFHTAQDRKFVVHKTDLLEENAVFESEKMTVMLPKVLKEWMDDPFGPGRELYLDDQAQATNNAFSDTDLRNYLTYFRDDYSEPIDIESSQNAIFKKLFGVAFYAKILDIYNSNKRTFQDILDGRQAYTEDLFYRIEKIKIIDGTEEVVQNVLIPNTSELDIVKYVDTQLKYSVHATYKYNVYVHRVVFGSKYKYDWLDSNDEVMNPNMFKSKLEVVEDEIVIPSDMTEEELYAKLLHGVNKEEKYNTFIGTPGPGPGTPADPRGPGTWLDETDLSLATRVTVSPSIIIVSDKIFSTPEILIMDNPPPAPDVNIVPYLGINNRIKILLSGASDRYRDYPVMILDTDEAEFNLIRKAQLSPDGKVQFASDDPVRNFQLFRTQDRPTSYSDFELYDQISKTHFEEVILPNTKYYYTFRAIDDHGHISNPSPVYEVELIDEKGAVRPIIKTIDISKAKNKIIKKECQKYIYLKPTLEQLYFSEDPEVDGIFSETQNKKKYKMRITSKGSGKKIDINFSFVKNRTYEKSSKSFQPSGELLEPMQQEDLDVDVLKGAFEAIEQGKKEKQEDRMGEKLPWLP